MILFHNDYNQTCHPAILERLGQIAPCQVDGYGEDDFCRNAADLIRKACGNADLPVHFLSGGTQSNLTVIAAALRPHQGVITAQSGHIHVHETGAIEATGHKILPVPSVDGKITASQIQQAVTDHWNDSTHEHIAQPKLVYISHPTEFGTTYTLAELEDISATCRKNGLYLYMDGARLGYALAARDNDVFLPDLARLCDAFYIGGTKVGAMLGEAVVIPNAAIAEDFRYLIKQRGGMLAKGWLMGVQFQVLFEDNLYQKISRHADEMADRIRKTLTDCGCRMTIFSNTNQIFVTMDDAVLEQLGKEFSYAHWDRPAPGYSTVRFCTSWATRAVDVDALCDKIRQLTR